MGPTKKRTEKSSDENDPSLPSKSSSSNRASSADTEAMSNHVVLKQVFLFLETKALLELSLVNQLWCSTARSVLRSHRKCLAGIKGENPCEELLRLDQVLSTSYENPFSGLAFRILRNKIERNPEKARYRLLRHPCFDKSDGTEESSAESGRCDELEPEEFSPYSAILEKLTLRHLEIQWQVECICPAQKLLERVLKEKREEFVELKLLRFPRSIDVPLKEYLGIEGNNWLPNLRVLDTFPRFIPELDSVAKLREYELIQAAPQLKKKLGCNLRRDLSFYLENNKLSLIKHYWLFKEDFFTETEGQLEEIIKFAESQPKLTKLIFEGGWLDSDHNGRAYKAMTLFLKTVLHSSSSSLEKIFLHQDTLVLDPLPEAMVKPLTALKEMTLALSSYLDGRLCFPTLEKVDWGGFFPALETLKFKPDLSRFYSVHSPIIDSEGLNIEDRLRDSLLRQPGYSPCRSVRSLSFTEGFDLNFSKLRYLGRMFPSVKEFAIQMHPRGSQSVGDCLEYLWTYWPDLERIRIYDVPKYAARANLDAKLCGILEKEAEAYLKEPVHVLRTRRLGTYVPCLLSFKSLKKLRIEINHTGACTTDPSEIESCSFLLTRVTCLLVFREMPGFEMEIARKRCEGPCGYQMEHLRPYVTLVDT